VVQKVIVDGEVETPQSTKTNIPTPVDVEGEGAVQKVIVDGEVETPQSTKTNIPTSVVLEGEGVVQKVIVEVETEQLTKTDIPTPLYIKMSTYDLHPRIFVMGSMKVAIVYFSIHEIPEDDNSIYLSLSQGVPEFFLRLCDKQ
jgi:hypothetical protein